MAELGSGSGTSYPTALDTDASRETTTTYARADVPNDLAAAIIAVQTTLGLTPQGSVVDVVARLNVSQNTDGTMKITGATLGSILWYDSTGAWVHLPVGNDNDVLTLNSTTVGWEPGGAGGSGKAFIELLPGSAKLPNSDFARLEKLPSTGVWNIIKFLADGSAASDEVAFFQKQVPAFYGGGNWTAQIQSLTEDTNTAHFAKFIIEGRAVATGEVWDGAYATLCAITVNAGNTATVLLIDTAVVSSNLPSASEMWQLKVYVDRSASDLDVGNKELRALSITLEEA